MTVIREQHARTLQVFTDGSTPKDSTHSGYGLVCLLPEDRFIERLSGPVHVGIIAEQTAILMALELATSISKGVCLYTDSLSTLRAISNPEHPLMFDLVSDIRFEVVDLNRNSIPVLFQWVPSHVGVTGNTEADSLVKKVGQEHEGGGCSYPPVGLDTAALKIHQHLRQS